MATTKSEEEPPKLSEHFAKARKAMKLPKGLAVLRESSAIALWGTFFVQFLIYDVGSAIVEWAPKLAPIFDYRFYIILSVIAVAWLLLGRKRFFLIVVYIVFYPIIIVIWRLPKIVFRNWAVLIAFSPAIHATFSAFRRNFILFTLGISSAMMAVVSPNTKLVVVGMIILGFYLSIHFIRRLSAAFVKKSVFAKIGQIMTGMWRTIRDEEMVKLPSEIEKDTDEYQQKYGQNLLRCYMYTTVFHIGSQQLKDVLNSRKMDLYFIGSLFYTFVLTAFVFSVEYYALERIAPGSFDGGTSSAYLEFLGLSLSTLTTSSISPIIAVSGLAQAISYLQLFSGLLIFVLLIFIILTSIRERYKQDVDEIIKLASATRMRLWKEIDNNYEMTQESVELWLLEYNPLVTKWLLKLVHGEERAKEIADKSDATLEGEVDKRGGSSLES